MSVIYRKNQEIFLYMKGAPEVVLGRCTKRTRGVERRTGSETAQMEPTAVLTETERKQIRELVSEAGLRGRRVIMAAYRRLPTGWEQLERKKVEKDLIFLGMAAMTDPLRPETKEAVKETREAGIFPVMITGDHIETGRDPHTWGSGSFRGSAGPDGRRRAGPEIREDQCLCQSIPGA